MKRYMFNYRLLFSFCILLMLSGNLFSQQITVSGTVIDLKGEFLIGATVTDLSTKKGVVTNIDGEYRIVVAPDAILEVSFLGYKKKQIEVNGKKQQDVVLEEEISTLEELVVVGYGTQKKANLTGAVTQISSDVLEKSVSNLVGALQGEMPGVVVTQSSGQPGEEDFDLKIRGYSSVNSLPPLILVDGVEGSLENLNPNDIESISVLKDAASSAIFGAKAAAGVILVTTKQGKPENIKLTYNGSFSFTKQGRMPKRLNSWEEIELDLRSDNRVLNAQTLDWCKNPNITALLGDAKRINYFDNTNWVNVGLKDFAPMHRHSVGINGGTRSLNYRFSAGYFGRKGFLKYGPDGTESFNFRLNLNSQLNKYVSMFLLLSDNHIFTEESAYSSYYLMNQLYRIRTVSSIYFPADEDPIPTPNFYAGALAGNPIDVMKNGGFFKKNLIDMTGQLKFSFTTPIPNLKIDLTASRRGRVNQFNREKSKITWYSRGTNAFRFSMSQPNLVIRHKDVMFTDKFNIVTSYKFKYKKSHNFNFMAGGEYERFDFERVGGEKAYMPGEKFFSLNYGEAGFARTFDAIEGATTASVFGRINYDYQGRYLLEANVRHDGNSRLAPENRWKTYPSLSGGWAISKESFFKKLTNTVSQLKIRASWGRLGNASLLGYYDYMNLITPGTTIFGGSLASANYIKTLASVSKTWETVEVGNIGLDIAFFKNRLEFSGEIYKKRNLNMLAAELNVPSLIGVGVSSANVGELETTGWEYEIRWRDQIKNFKYWLRFNLSDSKTNLTKYNGVNVIQEGLTPLLEGYPLNTIWGYKTDGLFQEEPSDEIKANQPGGALTNMGDMRYINLDDNPRINGGDYTKENYGDLVYYGTTDPRYTFGIHIGGDWRSFSFSFFLQGVGKRKFLLDEQTLDPRQGTFYQAMDFHRDYWTLENRDAFFPRPIIKAGGYNYKPSDHWIQNGAYIRMKNVKVSYKLPINKKIMENCQLVLSGENLFEFTKSWKAFDPEAPATAGSGKWYAFYRSVSLGLNITL